MTIRQPHRVAFLVVGMHRSGTSAFAGTLERLGLSVPADLMAADSANANGYYESGELAQLHNQVLRSAGSRWDDWSPIAPSWFDQPAARAHEAEIGRFLGRHFGQATDFVIKDPRLCRIMPLWRRALRRFGTGIRVVVPLRHPGSVARSLLLRDGLLPGQSYLLWLRHLLDAERATRGLPRAFVAYDSLLDDWRGALDTLAMRLAYGWPRPVEKAAADISRFLDPRLRHHQAVAPEHIGGDRRAELALEGWETFSRLARQHEAEAVSELDRLRAEMAEIPCPYRLPLGIGTAAGHVVHVISRLGSRLATGQRLR